MKEMKKTEVWRKIKEGKVTVIRSDAGWNGGVEKGTESKGHALCDKKGDLMELYGTAAGVEGTRETRRAWSASTAMLAHVLPALGPESAPLEATAFKWYLLVVSRGHDQKI